MLDEAIDLPFSIR